MPLATRSETDGNAGNRYAVATTFMVAKAAIDRVTTARACDRRALENLSVSKNLSRFRSLLSGG